uniref:Uncharacterized protein n=1 Tax=Panagrolaimus sp. PS1159 TaxID=55785 RepID=A0AC35GSD5_9BILA
MPKIYQCDAKSISIFDQMFSFNDLMGIASKCETLDLLFVVITNNDEIVPQTGKDYFKTAVSLEAFFKALPNVKAFRYILPGNSLNTTKTAEELLKIPISGIPEIFDIKSFYGHIKENKKTKIDLSFSDQISDAYKIQLWTIVYEILEMENRDYKVPRIYFTGISRSCHREMLTLYRQN